MAVSILSPRTQAVGIKHQLEFLSKFMCYINLPVTMTVRTAASDNWLIIALVSGFRRFSKTTRPKKGRSVQNRSVLKFDLSPNWSIYVQIDVSIPRNVNSFSKSSLCTFWSLCRDRISTRRWAKAMTRKPCLVYSSRISLWLVGTKNKQYRQFWNFHWKFQFKK